MSPIAFFRYPLKVVVEGVYDVKLYPEEGETVTILNIKRGIISALAVPLLEEEKNKDMVLLFTNTPTIPYTKDIFESLMNPSD